jgi:uncharacterized membrane protein YfcA
MADLTALEIAYCVGVMLLAYGLRGSTGFGGALGMPLLALVLPIKVLVPVWTLLGFASSVAILGRDRRHVDYRAMVAFMPWCAVGIAVGLYFFKMLDASMLTRGLGIVVLLYAIQSLVGVVRQGGMPVSLRRIIEPVAGTLSGAVGTMFGSMGSVFFAMYLDARAVAKDAFRATTSAMLLLLCIARGIGYYAVGEFTVDAWIMFAVAFPLMLAGIYVGDRIQVNISEQAFRKLVCVTLFVCGIPLLFK